ncbi:4'-phosphopantetheinyl transferase [Wolbachia endosymbiont (group A) of Myopa testacea]|uniref:4'-phosphopantetheinyl transferase family protein n=1 Tax=Wolbachia endosymbiont (group A) of Myopa testacea TaxID=3066148 RepID=UPI003132DC14
MIKVLKNITKNGLKNYLDKGYSIPEKIEQSVFKRQNEFAVGRLCAISALETLLGKFEDTIGQDNFFRPIWPDEIVGSISHSDNYAVAVVTFKQDIFSLGVDIEEVDLCASKINSIQELVITELENRLIKFLNNSNIPELKAYIIYLIFSAKESFFKCINPLCNLIFDFKDVELFDINLNKKTFKIKLIKDLELSNLSTDAMVFCGSFFSLFEGKVVYTQVDCKHEIYGQPRKSLPEY